MRYLLPGCFGLLALTSACSGTTSGGDFLGDETGDLTDVLSPDGTSLDGGLLIDGDLPGDGSISPTDAGADSTLGDVALVDTAVVDTAPPWDGRIDADLACGADTYDAARLPRYQGRFGGHRPQGIDLYVQSAGTKTWQDNRPSSGQRRSHKQDWHGRYYQGPSPHQRLGLLRWRQYDHHLWTLL